MHKRHFFYPSSVVACGGTVDDFDHALGLGDGTGEYANRFERIFTMFRSEITCLDCERAIIANAADCFACRDFVMTRKDKSLVNNHTCDPGENMSCN